MGRIFFYIVVIISMIVIAQTGFSSVNTAIETEELFLQNIEKEYPGSIVEKGESSCLSNVPPTYQLTTKDGQTLLITQGEKATIGKRIKLE